MTSMAISLKMTLLVTILLHTLTSFPLMLMKDKTLRINTNEKSREVNVSLFTNEGITSKEKENVQNSPVPPIWSLLRRVGKIHDNKTVSLTRNTLVLNVNRGHDIDKQTDDIHVLKQTDTSDIRNDIKVKRNDIKVKRNDIKVKRNDIELQDGHNKVVRNNETKIKVKSQLRKRSEEICTLSRERALILIQRIEHEYFELAGQAERVTGDDSQEVEYYLYKYTSGGFIKMIYRIDKCYHRVNKVSYDKKCLFTCTHNKVDYGVPCKNRAFGIGGSAYQGPIFFGRKPFCLETTFSNDGEKCILKNKYVIAVDVRGLEGSNVSNKMDPVEFDCTKQFLSLANQAVSPSLDAFFYATQTQHMLEEWFNYTRLQNSPIIVKVHYGINSRNGYQSNMTVLFGDGDDVFTSYATSPQVVAHEIGHMILAKDTNVRSSVAKEGFGEAFGDMLGQTLFFYIFGMVEWIRGAWLTKEGSGIMSLELPPMQFVEDQMSNKTGHYNGGVFARVFYRMSKFWGIRATMESLMCAKDLMRNNVMNTFEHFACKIIEGGYCAGLEYEIERYFKTVGVDITGMCPVDSMPVQTLTGTITVIVSSRRRPFFIVRVTNSKHAVFSSTPKVRITVSTDRQGRLLVQSAGLGRVKIRSDLACCQDIFVHFSTGVLAEKSVLITRSDED